MIKTEKKIIISDLLNLILSILLLFLSLDYFNILEFIDFGASILCISTCGISLKLFNNGTSLGFTRGMICMTLSLILYGGLVIKAESPSIPFGSATALEQSKPISSFNNNF